MYNIIPLMFGWSREGINFALSRPSGISLADGAPPPYVYFLSVLGEFSNRLLEVDRTGKKGVLVYLQVGVWVWVGGVTNVLYILSGEVEWLGCGQR